MKSEYIELAAGISKVLDYRGKTPQKLGSDWENKVFELYLPKMFMMANWTILIQSDVLQKRYMKNG